MKPANYDKYAWAQKQVKRIKGFYSHLTVYIVINLLLLIGRLIVLPYYVDMDNLGADGISWININVYGTTIIWGIAVLIHGLSVHMSRIKFLNRWEERKIKEFMDEEDHRGSARWQ